MALELFKLNNKSIQVPKLTYFFPIQNTMIRDLIIQENKNKICKLNIIEMEGK